LYRCTFTLSLTYTQQMPCYVLLSTALNHMPRVRFLCKVQVLKIYDFQQITCTTLFTACFPSITSLRYLFFHFVEGTHEYDNSNKDCRRVRIELTTFRL
uniref:Uncharacterized protein n=1 Tax=Sparus aurata TaxID=8175 RepID=A0A671USM3_SPAAU